MTPWMAALVTMSFKAAKAMTTSSVLRALISCLVRLEMMSSMPGLAMTEFGRLTVMISFAAVKGMTHLSGSRVTIPFMVMAAMTAFGEKPEVTISTVVMAMTGCRIGSRDQQASEMHCTVMVATTRYFPHPGWMRYTDRKSTR